MHDGLLFLHNKVTVHPNVRNVSSSCAIEELAGRVVNGLGVKGKNLGAKNVDAYCILKNQQQTEGKLPVSVGFGEELEEVYGILGRKTKSNILITGESGVGKPLW